MNRRAQRGTIDNSPLLWIVPVLALFAWYNWPGGPPDLFGVAAITWFTWIAWMGGGVVVLLTIGGFVVRRLNARDDAHRQEVARLVGSKVEIEFQGGWGQSTGYFYVPMRRRDYPVQLMPEPGSTQVVLRVEGGRAPRFAIDVARDGAASVRQDGREAGERFLDGRVRANLAAIARIGSPAGLAVRVVSEPGSLVIQRYGTMSPRETLLFLNLCWPVFDRGLEACFDQRLAPPAKACARCGGECCPTFDVAHAPGCGCA